MDNEILDHSFGMCSYRACVDGLFPGIFIGTATVLLNQISYRIPEECEGIARENTIEEVEVL